MDASIILVNMVVKSLSISSTNLDIVWVLNMPFGSRSMGCMWKVTT